MSKGKGGWMGKKNKGLEEQEVGVHHGDWQNLSQKSQLGTERSRLVFIQLDIRGHRRFSSNEVA